MKRKILIGLLLVCLLVLTGCNSNCRYDLYENENLVTTCSSFSSYENNMCYHDCEGQSWHDFICEEESLFNHVKATCENGAK